jgi:hypothetical protein
VTCVTSATSVAITGVAAVPPSRHSLHATGMATSPRGGGRLHPPTTTVATGVAAVTSSVTGVCCRRRGRHRRLQKPKRSFALGLSGLCHVLWRKCHGFGRRQRRSLCRNLQGCRARVQVLVLKLPCHL